MGLWGWLRKMKPSRVTVNLLIVQIEWRMASKKRNELG
jgi:hypothetical protein